jgi:CRISPR/Cas system-associated exonuclease Cas4 (RecB family)
MTDDRYKLSWSSLQRFELCKQKQYLVSKKLSIPGRDVRNFLAGTVVDSVQKAWLENPSGDMTDLLDEHFEKSVKEAQESDVIKWRHENDRSYIRTTCVEALKALQPILETRILPYDYEPGKWFYEPVKIQNPKTGQVEEIILRGEFDLLVRDNDGNFIVWDLKTTADEEYWKKSLGQLVFYDLVILAMFGKPPKKCGFIQPLCQTQVKEFEFTNEMRAEMWGRISSMMRDVWDENFEPKSDNAGCSFCEVAHSCKKFNKQGWGFNK